MSGNEGLRYRPVANLWPAGKSQDNTLTSLTLCPLPSSHESSPTGSHRVREPAAGAAFRGEQDGDGL